MSGRLGVLLHCLFVCAVPVTLSMMLYKQVKLDRWGWSHWNSVHGIQLLIVTESLTG